MPRGEQERHLLELISIMIKRFAILAALVICSAVPALVAEPAPAPEQQLANAIKEIQSQQAQIADNQAKIEAKLATIAEAVRVARIYSSRAGAQR